jgi:hypothetical protein
MNKIKNYNPTPIQFFVSTGIAFPFLFLFIFLGTRKLGFSLDRIPGGLLFSIIVLFGLVIYVAVHYLPPKVATVVGFFGWLTIPIALLFRVISEG